LPKRKTSVVEHLELSRNISAPLSLRHVELTDFEFTNIVMFAFTISNDKEVHGLKSKPVVPVVCQEKAARGASTRTGAVF
jgi:hypothetical protein